MIVLCPNCHAEFDLGTIAIRPETMRISGPLEHRCTNTVLRFQPAHRLSEKNIAYGWEFYCEAQKPSPSASFKALL
jgi:hypothetical protein